MDLTVKFHTLNVKESESGVGVGNVGKVVVGNFGNSESESEILETRSRSRKFWKLGVGVGNFGNSESGVGAGYFTSESAALVKTSC